MDREKGLLMLGSFFVASLTASNFLASKIALLGDLGWVQLTVPAAVVAYAITFTFTDIIAEVYGRSAAESVVRVGFVTQLIILALTWSALALPPAPFQSESGFIEAYNSVFASSPNIILASLTAYLISQHHDVWSFHWWRERTKGRWLWLRNNASTSVSQLLDTAIFITLAFGVLPKLMGGEAIPVNMLGGLILGQYIVKLIIALADTPFVYVGVALLEGRSLLRVSGTGIVRKVEMGGK